MDTLKKVTLTTMAFIQALFLHYILANFFLTPTNLNKAWHNMTVLGDFGSSLGDVWNISSEVISSKGLKLGGFYANDFILSPDINNATSITISFKKTPSAKITFFPVSEQKNLIGIRISGKNKLELVKRLYSGEVKVLKKVQLANFHNKLQFKLLKNTLLICNKSECIELINTSKRQLNELAILLQKQRDIDTCLIKSVIWKDEYNKVRFHETFTPKINKLSLLGTFIFFLLISLTTLLSTKSMKNTLLFSSSVTFSFFLLFLFSDYVSANQSISKAIIATDKKYYAKNLGYQKLRILYQNYFLSNEKIIMGSEGYNVQSHERARESHFNYFSSFTRPFHINTNYYQTFQIKQNNVINQFLPLEDLHQLPLDDLRVLFIIGGSQAHGESASTISNSWAYHFSSTILKEKYYDIVISSAGPGFDLAENTKRYLDLNLKRSHHLLAVFGANEEDETQTLKSLRTLFSHFSPDKMVFIKTPLAYGSYRLVKVDKLIPYHRIGHKMKKFYLHHHFWVDRIHMTDFGHRVMSKEVLKLFKSKMKK
jgi:hypothetical protein